MLPHATGLYGNLSARENIEYFGALQGIPRARLRERTGRARGARSPWRVSSSAAPKASPRDSASKSRLARALVHDPANLVLDEPTNGLDVMAIRSLRDMLLKLKSQGRCILFSSHVMQEVAALCDRVVIIAHGRVLAQGTLQSIRETSGASSLEEAFLQVLGSSERLA